MELGKMVLMMMVMLMMIPMMPVTMVMKIHSGRWSPRQNLTAEKPFYSLAEFCLAAVAEGKSRDPPRVFNVEGHIGERGSQEVAPGAGAPWWHGQGVAAWLPGGPPPGLLLAPWIICSENYYLQISQDFEL